MNLNTFKTFLFIAFFSLTALSCSDDDSSSITQGSSKLTIKLVDNPGDYDHVYVDVVDVMVKVNDDTDDDNGWLSLEAINTGVYDLLELTGGLNVLLADNYEIPSGTLNQIRLVLGDNNTIVIDGDTFPLTTPSAQQSGLKIQVNETLEPNFEYTFWLDFDVCQSIVEAGNSGNIILKPVIRAVAEVSTGNISGSILPSNVQTQISVIVGTDVISTYTDENGNFIIVGLPSGTYDVIVNPNPESGFEEATLEDVVVVVGQTTVLETIELQ
ncbi:DUF4382 domain-containing protein [Psychroserpens algicola]|uniref:DUF4382 domain-containing protein n=1 Tax=Psychroserpens algicola TaxID=1719034 RepID=A0ABT0H7C2_9FLAO|nr:DUF4382 domain-containing protein [Psychroserpens algicola]MCK8480260.1 DUF4382 domain-containing protein [Psychroserpens algicola]